MQKRSPGEIWPKKKSRTDGRGKRNIALWRQYPEIRGKAYYEIRNLETPCTEMTDTSRPMVLKRQLLHSVNGSGKIILSEKMLDEAGLSPGMFIEVVIKKGSITIYPYFQKQSD